MEGATADYPAQTAAPRGSVRGREGPGLEAAAQFGQEITEHPIALRPFLDLRHRVEDRRVIPIAEVASDLLE